MIVLWVMSILVYLTWAIVQLEYYLTLDIKSTAIQQTYLESFQKAEHTLLACEQSLLDSHPFDLTQSKTLQHSITSKPKQQSPIQKCEIETIGPVAPRGGSKKETLQQKYLYHIRAGDHIRIASTVIVDHRNGTMTRLNWQQLHD